MATKEELEKIKRRSAAYWKKRSKELEEASFNRGMRTYRDIEEAFDQAQRSIDKEIEKWYYRIAENNDLTLDGARKLLRANELEEFKWDVKEYIKAGKENAVNQSWMKELENASGRYHISRLEALKIETQQALELAFGNEVDAIDKMARRTIDEDYLKTCYELQKGIGVGWPVGTIDNRTLDKIVTKPWAADGANFSDRIWTNKTKMVDTLHQNLTRACILGQSPDKAIAALTQFVDKSISNAKRAAATLVQTEQAYFHAKAQQEAYTAIGVEEFEVVATLDSHTSEICQEMDGEHFPMSQYEIGTTVPPFHPRCRSVTAPYFEDNFGVSGQRAARGDDADATYYVPENMTYKEWKEEQKASNMMKENYKPMQPVEPMKNTPDEIDDIIQYANEKGISLVRPEKLNGNIQMAKEQIEMVDEISKEFEIDPPAIRFEPLGLDTLGSTSKSARSIAVNNNALRDRKTINEYLNADNALAATDVKGIAAHEMGHVLCKRYSDIGVEIAKETYYNLYKETKSDSGMADWLYENISEYSIYGGELIPEVLSKHKTNPNSFTTEFIKLLKRRWRE